MTDMKLPNEPSKRLSARRVTLLASATALGIAVLIAGPEGYRHFAGNAPAHAAEMIRSQAGFADLVAKVKPAVISVRVQMDAAGNNLVSSQDDNSGPMQKFFQQFGSGDKPAVPDGGHLVITGEGSGFFISPDGYAVTNNHVVDHARSVRVTADDGTVYTAKVIGTDQKSDLALIKVDTKKDLAYVKFADQPARIGDWVVAVGNPFGLGGTVTAGIVSAQGRDIGEGPYDDFIQIDAPINKGNSGGPAFDINGNVIGVNTAIYSPSGGSVGIGFDIPATTAKMVVAQLKDKGHVTRGWIGVQIQPVTADIADSLGLKKAEGAIVDAPQPGSPAAKAGIDAGDVITAVNGAPVKDSHDLARKVSMVAPGTSLKLDITRNGASKSLSLVVGQMPGALQAVAHEQPSASSPGVPHLGLSLAPATDVAGAGGKGVVVTNVDPDGTASERGFKTGDVILDVAGKPVANAGDVRKALSETKAQGKHDALMRVKTADATRFIAVPLGSS
ncbi:MAG: serine protease Do [Hyphomicrobiales bacterium]|jgi:serine protease Do